MAFWEVKFKKCIDIRPKTRYGSRPNHQNTFINFQSIEGETNHNRCQSGIDFQRAKTIRQENKNSKIQEFNQEINNQHEFKNIVSEGRKLNSFIKKAEIQYNHERVNLI